MKKLKIGLFIDTWYPMVDGVIMVVDNYAKRLSKFCDVTVFTVDTGVDTREHPYKIVKTKSRQLFKLAYKIPYITKEFKKTLDEYDLDIVHIHSPFFVGKAGLKYAKEKNIPIISTLHSQFKKDFKRSARLNFIVNILMKNVLKVFDACDENYAVNNKISELFYEYGLKRLPKVTRNGTDMLPVEDKEKAIETVNKKYNIDKDTPVFLFVGRITRLKNVYFITEALAKLKNQDYRMFFVGEGNDAVEVERLAKKLGISDKIILTGKIVDRELLKALYLRAKLFLFPSKYDASSLVQIEAASQGTPTVFLEGTATSATVTDNVNGFIAKDSLEDFVAKIEEVLENKELYNTVSKNASEQLYVTWDECVQEMYKIYEYHIEENKKKLEQNANKK